MDGSSFSYSPESCWSLVSGHCSDRPTYAVFTKKGNGLPLAAKVRLCFLNIIFNTSKIAKVNFFLLHNSKLTNQNCSNNEIEDLECSVECSYNIIIQKVKHMSAKILKEVSKTSRS